MSKVRQLQERPLTHEWIWVAIDTIAARRGLSPSGLARLAGLDPTTFNRSKRFTTEGRPRWPSTESIAKILAVTATSLDEFAAIEMGSSATLDMSALSANPMANLRVVGEVRDAVIDDWEPGRSAAIIGNDHSEGRIAVAVADASLEPVYSRGNTLVVCNAEEPQPGDRVVVKPSGMKAQPRLLVGATDKFLKLGTFGRQQEALELARSDVDWIGRIVLVKQ